MSSLILKKAFFFLSSAWRTSALRAADFLGYNPDAALKIAEIGVIAKRLAMYLSIL
jgi:hypothetical protein